MGGFTFFGLQFLDEDEDLVQEPLKPGYSRFQFVMAAVEHIHHLCGGSRFGGKGQR